MRGPKWMNWSLPLTEIVNKSLRVIEALTATRGEGKLTGDVLFRDVEGKGKPD